MEKMGIPIKFTFQLRAINSITGYCVVNNSILPHTLSTPKSKNKTYKIKNY